MLTNIEIETYTLIKGAAKKYLAEGGNTRLEIAKTVLPVMVSECWECGLDISKDETIEILCKRALKYADTLMKLNH